MTRMQTSTIFKVSGKQTLSYTRQERSNVSDIEDHALSLIEAEGVNESTGKTDFMNGAHVINFVTSDLINFNGPIQGYSIMKKKDDSAFGKLEGKINTTLSAEGFPVTTIEVKLTWINGTGQFKNIRGIAIAKGIYISKNVYIVDWEGEYSI
jgi:hypothetical protein